MLQVINLLLEAVKLSSCLVPSGPSPAQLLTQAAVLRLSRLQHKPTSAGQGLSSLEKLQAFESVGVRVRMHALYIWVS